MYLFDTNHCSRIIQGDPVILTRLKALRDLQLSTCVIVRGELIFMAEKSQQKSANLEAVEIFLKDIQVLPVDDETATIYGHFKAEILEQLGPKEKSKMRRARIEELGIGENDLWIAAVALQHGLTILSADSDFGRMKAVRQFPLETWLSPVSMPPAASGD